MGSEAKKSVIYEHHFLVASSLCSSLADRLNDARAGNPWDDQSDVVPLQNSRSPPLDRTFSRRLGGEGLPPFRLSVAVQQKLKKRVSHFLRFAKAEWGKPVAAIHDRVSEPPFARSSARRRLLWGEVQKILIWEECVLLR
jgi:hypothetical protein